MKTKGTTKRASGTNVMDSGITLPNPFSDKPDDSFYKGKIYLKNKTVPNLGISYLNPSTVRPDKLIKDIQEKVAKAEKQGYENVRVELVVVEGVDYHYSEYARIEFVGDRMETDEEHRRRVTHIKNNWRREYDEFRLKQAFFASPHGLARLAEINK